MQDLRAQALANDHEVVMGAQAAILELAKLLHQTVQTPRPLHEVLDKKKETGESKKREEERAAALHNGKTPETVPSRKKAEGVF
jgi:hypothetical protein